SYQEPKFMSKMSPKRSEGKESEYPFFEGDGSSSDKWGDYVYDTDIEDVIEEEEEFVKKKGFGGEEDNIKDVVVVANDLCSSMIQTTLNVDFEEDFNTKSHELMSLGKSIIIKVSQSSFKFLIRKKNQEWYLKAAPMVDKFCFKTIKVREEVDETIGILIDVKALDHTKIEELGLNTCSHDLFLSFREIPSVDEPEPQLLPNFSPLDVNLGDKRGINPPINPYSLDPGDGVRINPDGVARLYLMRRSFEVPRKFH
nr:hypothetical protein [Tanacetum cinerariifolium]